jgi:hypothetical protein
MPAVNYDLMYRVTATKVTVTVKDLFEPEVERVVRTLHPVVGVTICRYCEPLSPWIRMLGRRRFNFMPYRGN